MVSSDLSIYHHYETARRLGCGDRCRHRARRLGEPSPDQACGYLAVAGLLIEAARRGLTAERLALCNSGGTAGSRDSVVG